MNCRQCDGPMFCADDNGATDGKTDRWELWRCEDCGDERTRTLTAEPWYPV